ncbi:SWIM zinc finger family protein [Streptomyces sp. NPDC048723]|uniref:SWIM zinc finger family protein n=1 Tax=unclassified Streptomyces TaxID=2593676 RepID=UPI003562266B
MRHHGTQKAALPAGRKVEPTEDEDGLTGCCDCPYGQEGNFFCKHCVAVGLPGLQQSESVPKHRAAAACAADRDLRRRLAPGRAPPTDRPAPHPHRRRHVRAPDGATPQRPHLPPRPGPPCTGMHRPMGYIQPRRTGCPHTGQSVERRRYP